MAGGVVSGTVTVCVSLALWPCASAAVQVTVVVPRGKLAGASLETVMPGQLSPAVALPSDTGALHSAVTSGGAAIDGGSASFTVTLKLHDVPRELEHCTAVVPSGKSEPEARSQVTVPGPDGGVKATCAPQMPASLSTVMSLGQLMAHDDGGAPSATGKLVWAG